MKLTLKHIPELLKRVVRRTFAHTLYLRTQVLASLPYAMNIELTNKCNLSCRMCARPKIANLNIGDMDFELFKKVLDEMRPFSKWNTSLTLVGLGEPLMYDKLGEAIEFAKTMYPHWPINLSTNGILLDSERSYVLTRLMGQGDSICVSLNAHNQDTYIWLMGADKYDLVVHNIRQFLSTRKTNTGAQKLKLIIQIMRTEKTRESEIQEFKKFWAPLLMPNDEISVKLILNWGGKIELLTSSTHVAIGLSDIHASACGFASLSIRMGMSILAARHYPPEKTVSCFWAIYEQRRLLKYTLRRLSTSVDYT